jgi:hypothetical protein
MRLVRLGAVLAAALVLPSVVRAGVPAEVPDPAETARQVDYSLADEVFAAAKVDPAPRCDDATFLRRAWLDLVGDIPTPEHVIAFLLDKSPDKRQRLVRELLADPQYGLNWARYWRDVIFYRKIEDRAQLAANALEADLGQQLNDNETWDKITAGFITATGDVRDNGATALIMAQDGRTAETTAEVARIFLGIQIQCAECHDHKTDRWTREQFHELAAFFPRIGVRPVLTPTRRSFQVVASDRGRGPRRDNTRDLPVPEHYMPNLEDPASPGTRMQPKFFLTNATVPYGTYDADRRGTLAKWLTENQWFAEAMLNRLWAELVGEGFYEPIDDLGPDHPATAPKTVKILAEAFRASGYDVKWLFETICATEAYQRESRPRREADGTPFVANVPQPLRADQLFNALLSATDAAEDAGRNGRRRGGGGPGRAQNTPRGRFNLTFGYDPSDPRDAVTGSIPQVLAMMNSPQVAGALRANRGLLKRLLAECPEDEDLVVELYLRILSREPESKELQAAKRYVSGAQRRGTGAEDLAWALLNSAEFRHRR